MIAFGPSLDDDDLYVLIRGYASAAELRRSQDAFYGSAQWRQGPRDAVVSLIESDISVVIPADSLSVGEALLSQRDLGQPARRIGIESAYASQCPRE